MKELYLIRHSKSSWKDLSLRDFDRPLNKRGKRDAPFMSKLLKEKNIYPDLIISSPAKRTKDTAKVILKELKLKDKCLVFDESIYESSKEMLIKSINNLSNEIDRVFFIGHNPSLNELASFLLNREIGNIPTSGILALNLNVENWAEIDRSCAREVFFEYPKKYFTELKID